LNEWTPKEDKMLRKNRPKKTYPQLAKMMNRSESAIRLRSRKLGLRGPAMNKNDAMCWKCQKACRQSVNGWDCWVNQFHSGQPENT